MAKIEGFRIKNFRALKDVTLGRLWNQQQSEPLTPMTAVIGKNGVGKSTLFDAFGFLAAAGAARGPASWGWPLCPSWAAVGADPLSSL